MKSYIQAATKILKYCKENPPYIEMFKIQSELYGKEYRLLGFLYDDTCYNLLQSSFS